MKKIGVLYFIFSTFFMLCAGNTEMQGTFLNALLQTNPVERADKLMTALEYSGSSELDKNIIRCLKMDLELINYPQDISVRLAALLTRHPADMNLMEICDNILMKNWNPALNDAVDNSLCNIDFNLLNGNEKQTFIQIFNNSCFMHIINNRRQNYLHLCDTVCKKYPENMHFMQIAVFTSIRGCFLEHSTAPGMKGFDKIAKDDFWNKRLAEFAGKVQNVKVNNDADAEKKVMISYGLFLKDTPQLLKDYAKRYESSAWTFISFLCAKQFKNSGLFIPCGENFNDFLYYVSLNELLKAETVGKVYCREQKIEYEKTLAIILAANSGNCNQALKLFYKSGIALDKYSTGVLHAIITAAHVQKDLELCKKIIKLIVAMAEKGSIGMPTCNAIGYVCADLNIELSDAERLIRYALQNTPMELAYHDSLAWVLYRQGKFAEAEIPMEFALKRRNPEASSSVLLLHAAAVKVALKKYDEAVILLQNAIKLYDPDDFDCHEYDLILEKQLLKQLDSVTK